MVNSGHDSAAAAVLQQRMNQLVTGLVIGVMGVENSDGDFQVEDVLCGGIPPQLPWVRARVCHMRRLCCVLILGDMVCVMHCFGRMSVCGAFFLVDLTVFLSVLFVPSYSL